MNKQYPLAIISFASTYGTRPDASKQGMGPGVVPLTFNFTPTDQAFDVSMQGTFPLGLPNIQTVYIDNSASATRSTIIFPISGETIVAEPFTRGFYPAVTNALTFTVTNTTPTPVTVFISCYDFIVPPTVQNATGLVLGSGDEVIPARSPTDVFSASVNLASTVPVIAPGFSGAPFYYVSALNVSIATQGIASSPFGSLTVYDSIDAGATARKLIWGATIIMPPTAATFDIGDQTNLMVSGIGNLYIKSSVALAGSVANVNIYGGRTAAQF